MNDFYPSGSNNNKEAQSHELLHKLAEASNARESQRIEFEERKRNLDREFNKAISERRHFIESSGSVPAPIDMYALWLKTYLLQGNDITHSRTSNYPKQTMTPGEYNLSQSLSHIDADGPHFEPIIQDYTDQDVVWMPTKSFEYIPTGYGSTSMTILLPPNLQIEETSLDPTSGDNRQGWEYGHTTVLRLKHDNTMPNGLYASTNNPYVVESYPDVEAYIQSSFY